MKVSAVHSDGIKCDQGDTFIRKRNFRHCGGLLE